jgi:serine protease Do
VAGSPAAEAGVREADILLKVEDEVIDSRAVGGFEQLFATRQPGEQVKLQGLRDGEPISFTLALATAPATWADAPTHRDDALGLTVKQITADYVEERRLQAGQQGVVVVALTEEGVAARAGLREGDILVSASGRPLESLSVFQRALAAGGNLDVEYLRGGSRGTTTLER